MLLFIIGFTITLISYLLHTICHYLEDKGRKLKFRKIPGLFDVIIFSGYFAWGLMMFADPSRIKISSSITLPIGLFIGIVGTILFIASGIQKNNFENIKSFDQVITTGVYTKIRHPMYLGIILIHLGFPLAFCRLWTLLSAVIWIGMILIWRNWEEKELKNKFGTKYLNYQKKTLF